MLKRNIEVQKRITFLFFCILFVFFLLGLRLVWLQLVRGTWFQQQALQNRIREIIVEPKRGVIYDRRGHKLAVSISADAVYGIPAEVKLSGKAAIIARSVAQILGMDEKEVYKRLARNQHSVWIKFKVEPEQAQALRRLRLPGIGIVPKPQRFYPKKNLAAHVLGIAGDYNQGLEGIELAYDKELSGVTGRLLVECDAVGREIPESTHKFIPPEEGLSVVLTIDQTIQYIAERELDKVVQERRPRSALIIVMDPRTGEILALANRPDFDPNNYQDYPEQTRRNLAVSNSYEPGSTFKIVTLAAALEENLVRRSDRFFCPGYIKVGDRSMHCWLPEGHGSESLVEVVQDSCNPGFITIGLRVGVEKFYKYMKAFGFGRSLGIDLPGEASGIMMPRENVKQVDLASMSIGQANAITPLQLISALAAIANDGKLMRPYLVKELRSNRGRVVKRFKPQMIRQVISEETAQEMKDLLEKVVSNGTGRNAYIEGYTVAGKTGTAQKPVPGGGYSATDHVASFVGFALVDNPCLAVLVAVDTPQGYPYFGGVVAAPVFREVMRDTLRYLGVPLRYQPQDVEIGEGMTLVPPVVNLPIDEAEKILDEVGLQGVRIGQGSLVISQVPADGVKVRRGSKVLLNLTQLNLHLQGELEVPQLKGKTLRDVAELLGMMNLTLVPEGYPYPTGIAEEQDPPAGTRVLSGSKVRVKFKPPPFSANSP